MSEPVIFVLGLLIGAISLLMWLIFDSAGGGDVEEDEEISDERLRRYM